MPDPTGTRPETGLSQAFHTLPVATRGPGLVMITDEVGGWLSRIGPPTASPRSSSATPRLRC